MSLYKSIPHALRFGKLHRWLLYWVTALVWLTGVLWLGFHYFLRITAEFGAAPHPLEIWWLRLHGLTAFAILIALGSVLPVHVRRAWQLKKNRMTGLIMGLVLVWLSLTGYALYYFSSDANESWLPLLHWLVGLALPLALVLHIQRGRALAPTVFNRVVHNNAVPVEQVVETLKGK